MKRILLFALLALSSVPILSAQNLLTNGNFETGGNGVGFNVSGTGYVQLVAPFTGTTVQGNFALTNNPAQFNTSYLAVGDHSTGTGAMLMVDGNAVAAGQPLFWQTGNAAGGNVCGLTIGNNYVFTYWVRSLSNAVTNAATQANILLVSNNATAPVLSVGNTAAPLPAAGWQQVSYTFTASAACVQLGLWNNNTSGTGNDFAVDDFSLVALPTATISAAPASVCVGGASPLITFTGANGTPPYTFNYTLNTVAQTPVTTTSASASVTVPVPTGTPGTFTYALTSVSYGTTPTYTQNQTGSAAVVVKPVPTGTISGPATTTTDVCQNTVGTYITFLGANGTAPYFFYYNINAGPTQIVSSGSSNSAAVLVPTGTTGTFVYELIKTTYSNGPACEDVNTPGSVTSTFNILPVPTATISGTTNVCLNAPGVFITFTGGNSTAPYTFNYTLNGAAQTVSTTAGSSTVTVPVVTTAPGTFEYELVSVSTGAAPVCLQPATGSAVVTVGPPTSTISGSTTILPGDAATLTFNGTPGATITFTTTANNPGGPPGAPVTVNTSIVIGSDGVGTYNIPYIAQNTTFSLVSATSGLPPFCTQPLSGSATVTVNLNTCSLPLAEVTIDVPQPICNSGECSELLAHFSNVGSTTDYVVSPIPYCPSFPFTGGTQINVPCDDVWSNIVSLPFQFNFYGTCYNQVRVGSNGVITFDLVGPPYTAGGCGLLYCNWPFTATIPNTAFPIKNAIYGVYQDTNMAQPPITNPAIQNVNYYVLDTGPNVAPNRVFVANFNELPQFSCNNGVGLQTSQIVIHETTNIIEVFVNKRTSCTGWNSGSGLIGIQNLAGTLATVPPGRNTGTWAATNEAWRFYPRNIPTIPTEIRWEQVGAGPIGAINENPLRICPTGPTTYTAIVKYTNCGIAEVRKDIFVDVAPPLPVADPVDIDICSNLPPPYTVNINQTPAMIAGIPNPGDYWIKYYLDEQDAINDAPGNLTTAQLNNYITSGPFPITIYVRIEDLVTTGCFNIRPFVLDVGGPSGTFAYPNSPFCNNTSTPEAPTLASLTPGGSYTAQSVPPGSTLILDPVTGAITPAGSDPAIYIVTYSIPASPPCPAYDTQTSVEIVLCTCTVTASANAATLCANTLLTPITYTTTGATSGSVTSGTLPPGTAGTFAGGIFTVSGTPTTPGVYTYTVSIVSGADTCTATTTITVNDIVDVSLSSAVGTNNQTVCINTPITNITYLVANGGTGATATGLPAGLTQNFAAGTLTISGSPSGAGTFNYTVTTTGGCGTDTATGTIIVNPVVTIALTSAIGTDAQTVCMNTAITPISYTIANGATGATVLGLPGGVTGTLAGTVFTISGTPPTPGTYNYTVTTTGGCSSASLSGTIIVSPNVAIALTSAVGTDNQTVCINTPITNIVYGTTNGATGVNATGLPAGVTGNFVGSTGVYTLSGSPTGAGTYNYSLTTVGGCSTATITGTIIVNPNVTIVLTSPAPTANQTVCINTPITNIVYTTANGATGVTPTGLPTGVTGAFVGNVYTLSGSPSGAGTFNYTLTTTGGCGTATINGTITVNPDATIALTSATGTDAQTVCTSAPITSIEYTVANGATGATVTGLPTGITGTYAGGVFTISGSTSLNGTFNYTVTTSGGCSSASLSGSITVNPDVTITLTSLPATAAQTVCINDAIVNIVYTTANAATGVTATGLPGGVTGTFVAGVFTISGAPNTAGVFNYTVTTTGGCGVDSKTGTITVNPAATIAQTSAAGTEAQTVCINTPIANITYAIADGGTGATVLGLPTGVTGTYAAGVFTISGTPSGAGIFNYTVSTTGGCGTASLSGTITVNPDVTIALTSAVGTDAQTVCINTPITNIVYTTANGATGVTDTGLPAGVTGAFVGGVYTLSGSPSTVGTFNYTLTTTGGCSTDSATGTIIVNPDVTIVQTSAAGTEAQTLCINTPITNIVYTVGNGATGATVTGLPGGVTGTFAAGVFTISGSPNVAGPFNYTVTTTGGCGTASLSGTITVNPDATIALTSPAPTANQTVCINAAITNIVYTIANGGTGATVTGLPTGITGTYAAGVFTISGATALTGPFNYTVTTTGGCSSDSESGTITINPDVTIALTSPAPTANQTVCINTPITNIVYTIANNATGATTTGLPAGVNGNFVAGVYTLSGSPSAAGVFNYTVTTTGGCGSASINGTITVNPNATIVLTSPAPTAAQTVCINTPIVNIVYTVANGATGASATGLPAGVTGTFAAGVYTISGTPSGAGTFNYTVTTSGGCATASLSGSIIVTPNVTLALTSAPATTNQSVCINTAITNITYAVANAGTTGATVTGLPTGVTGTYAAGVFTISGTPTGVGTFNYIVTTAGGCSSATLNGTIIVRPNATLTLTSPLQTANQTVCINTPIVATTYAIGNGATGASITSGGLPAGVTGTFAGGVFTVSGTPTNAGTFNYAVTTTGGCSSASLTGVIVVKPNVTLVLTSSANTTNQIVCMNIAISPITYTPGNGATGATVTGLPTGISGSFAGGIFTISGSTALPGTYNYTVTTAGGCSTASLNGTIQITPNVTVTRTSAVGTDAQQVCEIQQALVNITYAVGNGATGASVVAGTLPIGISQSFAGGVLTISGTPTEVGSFTYTVTTTGGCGVATATGTIRVNPLPVITLPQGFICVDQSGNPLPGSNYLLTTGLSAATHTFQWANASGDIPGAIGSSYLAEAPGTYSVTVTNNLTGCYNTGSTTVITSFPPQVVRASASLYFAEDQSVSVAVLPVGNYEYQLDNGQWQDSNQFHNLPSGYHTITVRDKVGCGEMSTEIRIIDYPKFFTPNNDGYNDTWNIFDLQDQPMSKIEIFDRYGKLLKEISPQGEGWNGTLNGYPLPSTDYWFKVHYSDENGNMTEFKSHFSLKR